MSGTTRTRGLRDGLAAAGVILSMLFVGYEIRQNTAAQRSATIEGLFDQRVEQLIATWTDSEMPGIITQLRNGARGIDMTPDEVARGRLWLITYMRILEGSWRQVSLGVVDAGTYEVFARGAVLNWPFLHEQWPSMSPNFDPEFVAFVSAEFGL